MIHLKMSESSPLPVANLVLGLGAEHRFGLGHAGRQVQSDSLSDHWLVKTSKASPWTVFLKYKFLKCVGLGLSRFTILWVENRFKIHFLGELWIDFRFFELHNRPNESNIHKNWWIVPILDFRRGPNHYNPQSTEFPIPSFKEMFRLSFREFPRLVGRYCS